MRHGAACLCSKTLQHCCCRLCCWWLWLWICLWEPSHHWNCLPPSPPATNEWQYQSFWTCAVYIECENKLAIIDVSHFQKTWIRFEVLQNWKDCFQETCCSPQATAGLDVCLLQLALLGVKSKILALPGRGVGRALTMPINIIFISLCLFIFSFWWIFSYLSYFPISSTFMLSSVPIWRHNL